tara:strand:+ start:4985 stop:5428 length:444 start_codon:yes stop_codon:yes gene_type:complete
METTINLEFEKCLKRGKIKPFSRGKFLAPKEMQTAKNDLKSAQVSFKQDNYKWAAIQCYYSMFHSGRALLFNKNFQEKSHYCLIVALRSLYVDKGKLSFQLIEALQKAKTLREEADYYDRWSQEATEFLLDQAREFLQTVKNLLKLK